MHGQTTLTTSTYVYTRCFSMSKIQIYGRHSAGIITKESFLNPTLFVRNSILKIRNIFWGVKRWKLHIDMRYLQCSVRGCKSTVYFCRMFNDAGNNEGHIASKGKDTDLSRNGMHLGGTGRGLITYCLVICLKVLRKATKDIRQDTMFRLLPYTPLCPSKSWFWQTPKCTTFGCLKALVPDLVRRNIQPEKCRI